jgi:hypothetical protein
MEKNKLIMFGVLAVVILLVFGTFAMTSAQAKEDCKLVIKSNSTLSQGNYIKVKLSALNNTPISNQTINITITDENKTSEHFSVVTNENGEGKLKLDQDEGKYNVTCNYGGNEKYAANSTSKKIKIENKVEETQTESTSSSSSSDDGYTYSNQKQDYVKNSGEWSSSSNGDQVYSYQGSDGVIYEEYYDSNGNKISSEDHYR